MIRTDMVEGVSASEGMTANAPCPGLVPDTKPSTAAEQGSVGREEWPRDIT